MGIALWNDCKWVFNEAALTPGYNVMVRFDVK